MEFHQHSYIPFSPLLHSMLHCNFGSGKILLPFVPDCPSLLIMKNDAKSIIYNSFIII
jgi:hypothetical protein